MMTIFLSFLPFTNMQGSEVKKKFVITKELKFDQLFLACFVEEAGSLKHLQDP